MSFSETKGRLSQNVFMTRNLSLYLQLLYLFLPPHHAPGLSCTQTWALFKDGLDQKKKKRLNYPLKQEGNNLGILSLNDCGFGQNIQASRCQLFLSEKWSESYLVITGPLLDLSLRKRQERKVLNITLLHILIKINVLNCHICLSQKMCFASWSLPKDDVAHLLPMREIFFFNSIRITSLVCQEWRKIWFFFLNECSKREPEEVSTVYKLEIRRPVIYLPPKS